MSSNSNLFDLEAQLAFYKAYHNTSGNVFIHSIFMPTILFTSMRILNDVEVYGGYKLSQILAAAFGIFYIVLKVPTGVLASVILVGMNKVLNDGTVDITAKTAWILFVVSWIFQFIGHGVFEKRKPVLLDNLVQSLVLAPYFILFELLFSIGLMPDLKKSLQARVDAERKSR